MMLTRLIAVSLLALALSPCTAPFQTVGIDGEQVQVSAAPVDRSMTLRATRDPRAFDTPRFADRFKRTAALSAECLLTAVGFSRLTLAHSRSAPPSIHT